METTIVYWGYMGMMESMALGVSKKAVLRLPELSRTNGSDHGQMVVSISSGTPV